MALMSVRAGPAPPWGPGGGDARVANSYDAAAAERDCPACAIRAGAASADVATEVDRSVVESLAETVGKPALADATEVDGAARGNPRPRIPHLEHVRECGHLTSGCRRGSLRRMAPDFCDGAVVSRGDECGKAGRIHQAVAERVRVEADVEQFGEQGRHRYPGARRGVEAREFASRVESRELTFERIRVRDYRWRVVLISVADDHLTSGTAESGENMANVARRRGAHETYVLISGCVDPGASTIDGAIEPPVPVVLQLAFAPVGERAIARM